MRAAALSVSPLWPGSPVEPRAWQARALPLVVEAVRNGERPVVSAVPGAGKSHLIGRFAKLADDKVQRQGRNRRIVIATPTVALVRQLAATIAEHVGPARVGVFYGEKKQPDRPVIVVCNPSLEGLAEVLEALGAPVALLIQDECHSSEAQQVKAVVPRLNPSGMVGFTGTPFRSVESESLSLWTTVAVRYTLAEALRDRVLVPWGCEEGGRFVPFLSPKVPCDETDYLDAVCLEMIRRYGRGPGVVSALTTADADAFAAYLCANGVRAAAIHSKAAAPDALVDDLRTGRLSALVHVNMLSEGVDFPWLRWLCMRRPVAARVRFVQEMMRPLRAAPGKPYATLLDPHDLLGQHGIAHAEALGTVLDEEAVGDVRPEGKGQPKPVRLPPAVALDEATRWARALLLSLQSTGSVTAASAAGPWRTRRPTERDIRAVTKLGRVFSRYLPEPYHEAVLALSREPVARSLQRGAVVDLICVLGAVADAAPKDWRDRKPARRGGKGWTYPWPEGIDLGAPPPGVLRGLPKEALVG